MIHFAQAQFLFLLLLIPLFFIVFAVMLKLRQRRIRKFGDENLVRQLMPSYAKEGKKSTAAIDRRRGRCYTTDIRHSAAPTGATAHSGAGVRKCGADPQQQPLP